MKITIIIDGQEKEVELSDEAILAIGRRYFELPKMDCVIKTEPINTDFCVMEQLDKMSVAHCGDIRTGTTRGIM